jgi:hypothetical protein
VFQVWRATDTRYTDTIPDIQIPGMQFLHYRDCHHAGGVTHSQGNDELLLLVGDVHLRKIDESRTGESGFNINQKEGG